MLIGQLDFEHNGTTRMTTTKSHGKLNRLTNIVSGATAGPILSSGYQYNAGYIVRASGVAGVKLEWRLVKA
jgi:hypothetical protein